MIARDMPGDIGCWFGIDCALRRAVLIKALLLFSNLDEFDGIWLDGCSFLLPDRLNRSCERRSTGLAPEDMALYCLLDFNFF